MIRFLKRMFNPSAEPQWISTAPQGNVETGPFIDLLWCGGGVTKVREDFYRVGSEFRQRHGYHYGPAPTIFGLGPTHWRPARNPAITPTSPAGEATTDR